MAAERNESPGKTVGYRVRFENSVSNETCIEYETTELLIRRFMNEGLKGVTHVFIDESHERNIYVDMLLLLLKLTVLAGNPENIKIVIMSATLQMGTFSEYFSSICSVGVVEIPIVTYPVRVASVPES